LFYWHFISYDLTGNGWTYLALVFNASVSTLTLYRDCQVEKPQPIAGNTATGTLGLHIPQDSLVYFRQEPGFKKKFLVRLYFYIGNTG
jgi:hypothetical protein